jgi:hypothetical protein
MTSYTEDRPGRVDFDVPLEAIPNDDEPRPQGGWSDLIRLALTTSGGQRVLMFFSGAALIALLTVLHAGSQLVRGYLTRPEPRSVAPSMFYSRTESEPGPGEPEGKPTRTKVPGIVRRKELVKRDERKKEVHVPRVADKIAPRREEKPAAPSPFLSNPDVPFDISSAHPDAIASNDEIYRGVSKLSPHKQRWVERRVKAELDVFIAALKDARTALASMGYGRGKVSSRAFSLLNQLEKGRATFNQRPLTDEEMNGVVRSLIASAQHLAYISNNGAPIHVPSFYEAPNPEFAAWVRKYGRPPRTDHSTDIDSRGGFQ